MFERDVNKVTEYYALFAPELLNTNYTGEIWALYEDGKLTPNSEIHGHFEENTEAADVDTVMQEIRAALEEEEERLERMAEEPEE